MKFFPAFILAAASLAGEAQGQFGFGMDALQQKLSTPSAQASVSSYTQEKPFYISFSAEMVSPWHAYYRNPATVGMPIEATLQAPEGFTIEGPFWKVPSRVEDATGVSYSYSAPLLVWKLTPEPNAPAEASFTISSSIQACSGEGCMPPEQDESSLALQQGDNSANPEWDASTLQQVEVLGDSPAEQLQATQTEDEVQLHFSTDTPISTAYFFSDDNSISPTAEQKLEETEGGYILHLPRNDGQDSMYPLADKSTSGKPLPLLKGILTYGDKHCRVDFRLAEESAPTTSASTAAADAPAPGDAGSASSGLPALFGALFLGGLILNLMPCVFPVIGLKIMGFVELGGGSRHKVFMHALAFVLGVLLSFWVISLLLIIFSNLDTLAQTPWQQWAAVLLDDAGAGSRSWAAWMQNEWIVYLILLLLLVLGLSMFGLFEIGVTATGAGQSLQSKKGYIGSFFSGLLVTVVATPCSAPFLGAAMPAAMALPGLMMVAALTFMALGLAFPYIVLGACPSLVNLLPRPGAWMESLKQGLSFLLFAAAAWLLDVYLAFVPESLSANVPWMLMSLVVFCAAFWVYGRWCPLYRSRLSRSLGLVIALALAALGVWGSMPQASAAADTPATEETELSDYTIATATNPTWNVWSPELMEEALEDGYPVYVDYTAKWCATCQANKKVAYTDEVYALMAAHKVVLMRADKTRPNAAIDAAMRELKRSAVPVNALYIPDEDPAVTRELLTASYLLEWLEEQLESIDDTDYTEDNE